MAEALMNVDWAKFGSTIREHRLERQLSQSDVAARLGISQAAVSLIERGTPSGLNEDRLATLLALFDISGANLPTTVQSKTSAPGQKVFISYSHKDKDFVVRLLVHLRPLEKKGLIDLWIDTRIAAGEKWRDEIENALKNSRVAILLVSADFLASDFIVDNELPPLLKGANEKGTTIIPVVLRPCRFLREKSLSTFQSMNSPDEPISGMDDHEKELVYDGIAQRIEKLFEGKS